MNVYTDNYRRLKAEDIVNIRENYKVLDVVWLDVDHVYSKMNIDVNFEKKTEVVKNMLDYYLNHKDRSIYKQTDYLCNEREKICICNQQAMDLRNMFQGGKDREKNSYISWIRKEKEHF